jgi:adenylosuccinate synthase
MKAHVVVGLCWGDEGKGTIVDALVRETCAVGVVRFNGGPQAAHHVVVDGHVHCFAQFGAGTFAGASTFLAAPCASDLLALAREARELSSAGVTDPMGRVTIHPNVVLVTPWHKLVNRLAEVLRGDARHGSCGMGVGQALLDAEKPAMPTVRMGQVAAPKKLRAALHHLWVVKCDQAEQMLDAQATQEAREIVADLRDPSRLEALSQAYLDIGAQLRIGDALPDLLAQGHVVFEGAQGVLLDRDHGDFPYVTPSYVTPDRAVALLAEADPHAEVRVLGVTRTYATRHGPGPFPGEDPGLAERFPELHNGRNPWQGPMRLAPLHLPSVKRGLTACGGRVDALAVTCLDCTDETLPELESLGLPIAVTSQGTEPSDKTWLPH